ncbi:MAG: hypothetical protein NVSMB38_19950 [Ktedonobacteraceae bacterium]
MEQRIEKLGPFTPKTWTTLLISSLSVLILLAICSYLFNWKWTGFNGNTLWDWLQLLVLPVSITAASIWFSTQQQWRTQWTLVLIATIVAFIVLAIGGYGFGWKWTGFGGNTLWDWLKLLILPIVLPTVMTWFTTQPSKTSDVAVSQAPTERLMYEERQVADRGQESHVSPSHVAKEELV